MRSLCQICSNQKMLKNDLDNFGWFKRVSFAVSKVKVMSQPLFCDRSLEFDFYIFGMTIFNSTTCFCS